ncbi:hypothetical protein CEB3_c37050 [Peptococcaceae bacterium CEB3]|nr:hypothetical protein CEB3_c37050 [Peptococcaceae bacterium CEB3]
MNPVPARLMQIYVTESSQCKHQALYVALTRWLRKKGILAETVRRGAAGYGSSGILKERRLCPLASKRPVVLECVDSAERIDKVLPEVTELSGEGICLTMDGVIWVSDQQSDDSL